MVDCIKRADMIMNMAAERIFSDPNRIQASYERQVIPVAIRLFDEAKKIQQRKANCLKIQTLSGIVWDEFFQALQLESLSLIRLLSQTKRESLYSQ